MIMRKGTKNNNTNNFTNTRMKTQQEVQEYFTPTLESSGDIYRKVQTAYLRPAKLGERIVTKLNDVVETQNTVQDDTSWILCAKTKDREQYILTAKNFEESYDLSSANPITICVDGADNDVEHRLSLLRNLKEQGFQEYQSKRSVFAHEVSANDIEWLRDNESSHSGDIEIAVKGHEKCTDVHTNTTLQSAHFIAPWGESMLVEVGDVLVMQYLLSSADGSDSNIQNDNKEIYRIAKNAFQKTYRLASKRKNDWK